MYAIRIQEYGGREKLVYEDLPVPEPGPGEVRVKVEATGLNFVEIYQRKGLYANPLPFTPGAEFAGIVDALGEGVREFQVGEKVATANGRGGYASFAIASTSRLVHIPAGITSKQAAAVLLQGMTAHYLALSTYTLKSGDTALVHAAAGGVGQLLVQIARIHGANVIGTVSTEEKAQIARDVGAGHVILYSNEDFEAEVKRLTGAKGVDVVYDSVGQATFSKSLNCLRPRGMLVLFGQSSGPVEPFNPQILNQKGSLFLTRPFLDHYLLNREELDWRAGDLFKWLNSADLKVRIDRIFNLEETAAAHEYIEARKTKGKVLLIPPG